MVNGTGGGVWVQQKHSASADDWSCEEVSKWVATIKGMTDDVGTTFLGDKVNGAALIVMGREYFKEIGVSQVGPLALLLGEITNLCQENKMRLYLLTKMLTASGIS